MGAVVFQKKYSFREYLAASMMVRPPARLISRPQLTSLVTHCAPIPVGRSQRCSPVLWPFLFVHRPAQSRACACAYFGNRRSAAYLLRIAEGCTGRT
jgi:hypothetical protein